MAPIPNMVDTDNHLIVSKQQILNGQATFQQYDLMDYGSILGNGTFLGPDFMAETLHIITNSMRDYDAQLIYGKPFAQLTPQEQDAMPTKFNQTFASTVIMKQATRLR